MQTSHLILGYVVLTLGGITGAAVYSELRRLSSAILNGNQPDLLLQPTVLLHEFYLKLPEMREIDWQSRAQFFNIAARTMRNILVDHARSRQSAKRGAGMRMLPIDDTGIEDKALALDVLMVNTALDRFAERYPRQAHVVELRFFGGLTVEEALEVIRAEDPDCSLRSVERDWSFARAWLQKSLDPV